jgi:hypothetical protein
VVRSCYANYLAEYGNTGAFAAQARSEVAAAQRECDSGTTVTSPLAPGIYNAYSLPACDAAAQYGIHVSVTSARNVSWSHVFRGERFNWSGTVDAQGEIRATVVNSQQHYATGGYSDQRRQVEMRYPQCTQAITLSILGKLQ